MGVLVRASGTRLVIGATRGDLRYFWVEWLNTGLQGITALGLPHGSVIALDERLAPNPGFSDLRTGNRRHKPYQSSWLTNLEAARRELVLRPYSNFW